MLGEFWHALDVPPGARVFVPLAEKTVDMPWLAERGYRVVEIEAVAVESDLAGVLDGLVGRMATGEGP